MEITDYHGGQRPATARPGAPRGDLGREVQPAGCPGSDPVATRGPRQCPPEKEALMTVEPDSSTRPVSALRVPLRVLVAAFALAVAGAGCVASLGEMRAKPAERVLVAPGRYADVG